MSNINNKILPIVISNNQSLLRYLSENNIYYIHHNSINIDHESTDSFIDNCSSDLSRFINKLIVVDDERIFIPLIYSILKKNIEIIKDNPNGYFDVKQLVKMVYINDEKTNKYNNNKYQQVISDSKLLRNKLGIPYVEYIVQLLNNMKTKTKKYSYDLNDLSMLLLNVTNMTNELKIKLIETINNFATYHDIKELVTDLNIKNINYYSKREISRLNKISFKKIPVRLVVYGINNANNKSNIYDMIKFTVKLINNMNPLENDFLIDTIIIDVLFRDSNDLDTLLDINDKNIKVNYIDIFDNDEDNEIFRFKEYLKSVHKSKYTPSINEIRYWYSLYKYQTKIEYEKCNDKIILVLNMTDPNVLNINDYLRDNITTKINEILQDNDTEQIHIYKDLFAFGTKRIMLYYMLLYAYLGSYKPWLNVRKFHTNGLVNSDDYYNMIRDVYVRPIIQMTEHIMHFTDIIISKVTDIQIQDARSVKTFNNKIMIYSDITNNDNINIYEELNLIFKSCDYDCSLVNSDIGFDENSIINIYLDVVPDEKSMDEYMKKKGNSKIITLLRANKYNTLSRTEQTRIGMYYQMSDISYIIEDDILEEITDQKTYSNMVQIQRLMNRPETILLPIIPIIKKDPQNKLCHNCNCNNNHNQKNTEVNVIGLFKMDTLLDSSLPQKNIIKVFIDSCENIGINFHLHIIDDDMTDEKNSQLEFMIEQKQIKIENVVELIEQYKKEKEIIDQKKRDIELIYTKERIKYIKKRDQEQICNIMRQNRKIITDIGRLGIMGLQYGNLVIYLGKNERHLESMLKEDQNVIKIGSDNKDIKNIVKMIKEKKIDRRFRRVMSNGEGLGEKYNWMEVGMNIIRLIMNGK